MAATMIISQAIDIKRETGLIIVETHHGTKIGELTVTVGGIQWKPTGRHTGDPKHKFTRRSRVGKALLRDAK